MSYLDSDPTKPTQELLGDIRAATQQPHFPGLPLLPFANLLVKVSTEASEAIEGLRAHITDLNEKNARLQWWVVALAIAALISTLVQTVVSIAAYIAPPAVNALTTTASPADQINTVSPKSATSTLPTHSSAASAPSNATSR